MNVETGFQLADVWGFVRRRAKHMAMVAGVISLAGYWLAMALPNEYESSSTILVEPQSVSKDLVEAGIPKSDINSRLHLMSAQILSRARLSRIIDELELYQEESKSRLREEIIDMMRDRIRVAPVFSELETELPRGSRDVEINTFRISFRHNDPRTAMLVAQRLANNFIEQHISERVKLSQKSLEFIQTELDRLSTQIREIEAQVAQVKAANPGRMPQEVASNQLRLDRIVASLTAARRQLAESESDEAFYRSQSATAASMSAPNDDASPGRRLQLLELELSQYQARGFTEKHPDIIKTRLEIEALKQKLETQEGGDEDGEPVTNFLQQSAEAESRRASLQAQAAAEEVSNLTQQADEIQVLLSEAPAVAEQLEGLERDYKHLFESYQEFSNKQLEASVQANLERRQLAEQFRVLEVAYMAPGPTSPNRSDRDSRHDVRDRGGGSRRHPARGDRSLRAHRPPAPGHATPSGAGGDPADLAGVGSRGAKARAHPRRARDRRRRRLRPGRRRGQLRLGERRCVGGCGRGRRGGAARRRSAGGTAAARDAGRSARRFAPRDPPGRAGTLEPPCTRSSTAWCGRPSR
jgi:uncharacterized protein involved in exopolysaccharide biosynthesis